MNLFLSLIISDSSASEYASLIREHTNLDVMVLHDTDPAKTKKLQHYHVLVMTADTFAHLLEAGALGLQQIKLLVMDECHQAIEPEKDHVYKTIMQRLETCEKGSQPRVLGMTSSILLGKENPCDLEENLSNLESILKSHPETALNSSASSQLGNKPSEAIVVCEQYSDCTKLHSDVTDVLDKAFEFVNSFHVVLSDGQGNPCHPVQQALNECKLALSVIGPLGVRTVVPLLLKDLQKIEKHEAFEVNCLMLQYGASQLRLAKKVCDDTMKANKSLLDLKFATPKVRRLLEVLKSFKPDENSKIGESQRARNAVQMKRRTLRSGAHTRRLMMQRQQQQQQQQQFEVYEEDDEDSEPEEEDDEKPDTANGAGVCGIVFVECRYVAAILDKLLRKFQRKDSTLGFISSSCIMGPGWPGLVSKNRTLHAEVQSRKQEEILRKFRRRETNLLFTTSVLEEGESMRAFIVSQVIISDLYIRLIGRVEISWFHSVQL